MEMEPSPSFLHKVKTFLIGRARNLYDPGIFRKISLIAFFAWVGLGADGITSSCYGPQEAFLALGGHHYLAIFVALGTALTIFVISASYSQIVEVFPSGGGGYLVASKLLSPSLGVLSGCALLVDYVLTITVSIASGADALFSFLPSEWYSLRVPFAILGVLLLTLMNLRGVKESVVPLVPIFLTFIITHLLAIIYGIFIHLNEIPETVAATAAEIRQVQLEIGFFGMLFLILRAYSMGAGTFTGIEAVSNGLPILREPKVRTAKRTMLYMALSLAFIAMGLMVVYLLFRVDLVHGKTLNAVLFETMSVNWGTTGRFLVLVTLLSEAVLLFVAAQTGFLGGPRVLANMALDRWVPTKFAVLSDRLVSQNGILLMGAAATVMMLASRGSVRFLVVLYSINVFITFSLSQLGMVKHWWNDRPRVKGWITKLCINGVGLVMTLTILISVVVLKFHEGGWITLLVTGSLVAISFAIKRQYARDSRLLNRLDDLVPAAELAFKESVPGAKEGEIQSPPKLDPASKTAVLLVNGFNGLGLHTLFSVIEFFGGTFRNFVFLQIGVVDAGNFKGASEVGRLETQIKSDLDRYVDYVQKNGYYAEGVYSIGTEVVDEAVKLTTDILKRLPHAVLFGGQLVFSKDSTMSRWLHNYTSFAIQRRLYNQGIPVVILPIRI